MTLCLVAPVSGPIVDPFVAPACPYCPGERTIDFASRPDEAIRAPIGGVVHFAGAVAGRVYVTIRPEPDGREPQSNPRHGTRQGILVTVGGVERIADGVRRGRLVEPGQILGWATGPDEPVSLSVRDDSGLHLDPTPHLGTLRSGGPRSRLIPVDGTARHPGPRAVCRPGG